MVYLKESTIYVFIACFILVCKKINGQGTCTIATNGCTNGYVCCTGCADNSKGCKDPNTACLTSSICAGESGTVIIYGITSKFKN